MSDPTIVITAELKIRDNIDIATGKEAIIQFCSAMRSEPGCLMADPHQGKENPRQFVLWEKYRDQTAFEAHFSAQHTQDFIASEITELVQAFDSKMV